MGWRINVNFQKLGKIHCGTFIILMREQLSRNTAKELFYKGTVLMSKLRLLFFLDTGSPLLMSNPNPIPF